MEKQVERGRNYVFVKASLLMQASLSRKYVNINSFIKSILQQGTFPVKFARVLHFEQWRKLSSGGRWTTSDIVRFNPFSAQTLNSILPLMTLSIFCSRLR